MADIKLDLRRASTDISIANAFVNNKILNNVTLYTATLFEESGAFTGEISAAMLVDAGVKYVILGHSERRDYFKEDDVLLNKKVKKAFEAGLTPILCCGESLEQSLG